jgi:hypothetical protein
MLQCAILTRHFHDDVFIGFIGMMCVLTDGIDNFLLKNYLSHTLKENGTILFILGAT